MRFSDIPIIGYRIEFDYYALGQFILEKFVERFGLEQILGANPKSYTDGYSISIIAEEKTKELQDFGNQLEDELHEKGVSVSILVRSKDQVLYGPRIKTKNLALGLQISKQTL